MNVELNYLIKVPDSYELVLVSFFATNPDGLARLEAQWAKRDPEHKIYLGRDSTETKKVTGAELGGSVGLIDPKDLNKGIIVEIDSPVATGMYYRAEEKTLYVGSGKWIQKIQGGKIVETVGNTLFNDVHTLNASFNSNMLVTSTGVDGILEVPFDTPWEIVWDWLATEHGYEKAPSGKVRSINRNDNYQTIGAATTDHTTHINSAYEYKPNKVLATLFHQGALVEIDKKTKAEKILLDGLKNLHHIRPYSIGFLLSDTGNNRVVLLDDKFKITGDFEEDYKWVHDCIEVDGQKFLIADSNNSRIVLCDQKGMHINELNTVKGQRKFSSFTKINAAEARNIFFTEQT